MRSCENKILVAWAMRFDGYRYQVDTGFDPNQFWDRYRETDSLDGAKLLDCLAAFFFWQRFLFKFGGESEAKTGPHWRFFRRLFLLTADLNVPQRYRGNESYSPEWYEKWDRDFRSHRDEQVRFVQKIHEATEYSID